MEIIYLGTLALSLLKNTYQKILPSLSPEDIRTQDYLVETTDLVKG